MYQALLDAEANSFSIGYACVYLRISEFEGIKLYGTKGDRNGAFNLQKEAFELGLGPSVGEQFEVRFPVEWINKGVFATTWRKYFDIALYPSLQHESSELVFGYVTEHAKEGIPQEEFKKLKVQLEEMGLATNDLGAEFNVGMTKNGKPVKIDFDIYHS